MPSGRYPYPRPCAASRCCFGHGDARQASADSGVSSRSLRAVGTSAHPSRMWRSLTALPDTASLRGRTGRLRRTVRNPLRSDRFLPVRRVACHLNAGILKLKMLVNVDCLPSDGAYPRPEGRCIAPAPRITRDLTKEASSGRPERHHTWQQNDGMAAHHCGHRNSAHHRRIS